MMAKVLPISILFLTILCVCPNFQFSNASGTISPQQVTLNASSEVGLATNFDNSLFPGDPPVDEPIACFTLNFTCVFENATEINFVTLEKQSDPNNASAFEREFQLGLTTVETGERFIVNYANSDIRTTNVIRFAGQYRCVSNTMRVTPTTRVDVLYAPVYNGIVQSNFSDDGQESRTELFGGDFYNLDAIYVTEGERSEVSIPLVLFGANPDIVTYEWTVNNNTLGINNNNNNNGKYAANASQLVISDVSRSNSGVYGVTAVNSAGPGRGTMGASLVVRFPPEYKNPSNLLYVRRGDPILLNCTPQATSADYGPIFNTEDLNGPPSFTRVSYQWTRNGTQQSTDSPILNITMEAETEHSGVYTCTASDEVVLITAQFNVAPAKKRSSSFFIPTDYIRLPTVLTTSEKFSPLETSVNFTVLVGGPPSPPDGLSVTYTSANSLLISWRGSEVPVGEEQVPLTYTLTLTGEDGTVRSETVQDTGVSGGQYQQSFDDIQSGVYSVALAAENPFGPSGSLSIVDLPVGDPGISTNIMFIIVTVILGVVLLGSIGLMVYVCYQKISIVSASRNMKKMKKKMPLMDSNTYMGLKLQRNPAYGTVSSGTVREQVIDCEEGGSTPHDNDAETSQHYNIALETNPSYDDSPIDSGAFTGTTQQQQQQQQHQQQHEPDGGYGIHCEENPAYIPAETITNNFSQQHQQQQQQHSSGNGGDYSSIPCEENPAYIPTEATAHSLDPSDQQQQQQQQQQQPQQHNSSNSVEYDDILDDVGNPTETTALSLAPSTQQQQQQQQTQQHSIISSGEREEPIYSIVEGVCGDDVEDRSGEELTCDSNVEEEEDEDQGTLYETYDIYDQIQS